MLVLSKRELAWLKKHGATVTGTPLAPDPTRETRAQKRGRMGPCKPGRITPVIRDGVVLSEEEQLAQSRALPYARKT